MCLRITEKLYLYATQLVPPARIRLRNLNSMCAQTSAVAGFLETNNSAGDFTGRNIPREARMSIPPLFMPLIELFLSPQWFRSRSENTSGLLGVCLRVAKAVSSSLRNTRLKCLFYFICYECLSIFLPFLEYNSVRLI